MRYFVAKGDGVVSSQSAQTAAEYLGFDSDVGMNLGTAEVNGHARFAGNIPNSRE